MKASCQQHASGLDWVKASCQQHASGLDWVGLGANGTGYEHKCNLNLLGHDTETYDGDNTKMDSTQKYATRTGESPRTDKHAHVGEAGDASMGGGWWLW